MNDTKKIKGYATTVTLAKDTLGYKAGHKFNTKLLREEGVVLVTGHGTHDIIPHDCLGQYEATWKEVLQDGDMTTTITKHKDVTTLWLNHWVRIANKRNEAEAKAQRAANKRRIAELRKIIALVKTGEAEKQLTELLGKI